MDVLTRGKEDAQTPMQVMSRFFAAYDNYDIEGMLSLHTDDALWTWIDPAKKIPQFGPDGKLTGAGKEGIRKLFEMDRGRGGFTGYILFSEVQGDTVSTIEIWENKGTREVGVPFITKSRYRLSGDKIAEWTWVVSPESTRRRFAAPGA